MIHETLRTRGSFIEFIVESILKLSLFFHNLRNSGAKFYIKKFREINVTPYFKRYFQTEITRWEKSQNLSHKFSLITRNGIARRNAFERTFAIDCIYHNLSFNRDLTFPGKVELCLSNRRKLCCFSLTRLPAIHLSIYVAGITGGGKSRAKGG